MYVPWSSHRQTGQKHRPRVIIYFVEEIMEIRLSVFSEGIRKPFFLHEHYRNQNNVCMMGCGIRACIQIGKFVDLKR